MSFLDPKKFIQIPDFLSNDDYVRALRGARSPFSKGRAMSTSVRSASCLVAACALLALALNAVVLVSPSEATVVFGTPQVFQETGSVDSTFVTPSNTCAVLIDALGGAGGAGYTGGDNLGYSDYGGAGGAGGSLSALVPVSGGQTLSVSVGQGGANGAAGVAGVGGYGGGGNGGLSSSNDAAAGGGGGESTVSILSGSTLAVAGGGGGGDDDWLVTYDEAGGGGGGIGPDSSGSDGGNAIYGNYGGDYSPGGGGTLSAPGAGAVGVDGVNGSPGSANLGGNGATGVAGEVGGGGGSGYFGGGGGGERSGGGGGSTYAIAGFSASNTSTWTPNPTVSTNGEVVLTAEECETTSFGAPPSAPTYGGSYTPSASSTSGLADTLTIDPSTTSVCSISGGIVSFNALGTCTVDANQSGDASWAPANKVQQSFVITQATPSSPTISNIPSGAVVGDSFTPVVSTTGDGVTTVTSNSPSVCSVASGVVSFHAVGSCALVGHVADGTNFLGANGSVQQFSIGQGTPSTPTITNLPSSAATGESFAPVVSTTGDGVATVTSNSPTICASSGSVVVFLKPGLCSLTAAVASGTNFLGANGVAQTLVVTYASHPVVIVFDSEGGGPVTSISAPSGQPITLPSAPQMPGYTFEGWYTASSGGTALPSPYTASASTTLYAQWKPDVTTTPVISPPSAPVIVGHSRSSGSLTVTVTRLPANGGSPITQYQCLVNGRWTKVTLNAHHQFTLHRLRRGRRYAVRLRAVNAEGKGLASNAVRVRIV